MFEDIEKYAGDPILSLVEVYKKDKRDNKVNLTIGAYLDNDGKLPLLDCVSKAEDIINNSKAPHEYLPMQGYAPFIKSVEELLFKDYPNLMSEGKIATIQTIAGSGALKIGANFLRRFFTDSKVYVSDPTWANHIGIFGGEGFNIESYPYYDKNNNAILEKEMLNFFKRLPKKSIVLMHPCCHNPTGVDLNKNQWDEVLEVVKNNDLILFLDMAYFGLANGFEEDIYPIKKAIENNLTFILSNSFSKILSLYGERIGSLSVVCSSKDEADLVLGQLKYSVRLAYSSPVVYSGKLVSTILNDEGLKKEWYADVDKMRNRMHDMRKSLYSKLSARLPGKDFEYFVKQNGLFSYSGLTKEQVARLKEEYAIYALSSGRICIAGLNTSNIDYVVDAFANVMS